MPKNWNRRFKHNREKIKTGDVFELAEVVRNLAIREQKGLSTGEKQMYTRAKKILASELMYALDMEEDEAESHLEELIVDAHTAATARRAATAATVGGAHLCPSSGSSRRRQRRTPWSRPAQGVRRLCRPSADRVEPRGARGRLRPGRGGGAADWLRPGWVEGGPSRSASVRNAGGGPEARTAVVHDAAGRDARAGRGLCRRADGRGRRDRGRAGHRHGQGGLPRRHRAAHARPLAPVGGPDAPGVPPSAAPGARRRRALAGATDDASLVEAAGGTVRLVEAPPDNFKVTTAADLARAEAALC